MKAEKILLIKVEPGWRSGTKITFEREGDQRPGMIPADVIFILQEKPHPRFKREKDDLYCPVDLTLEQALLGCVLKIPTLDTDRVLNVELTQVIEPNHRMVISNEGMPSYKHPSQRGNLTLLFSVHFPKSLSQLTSVERDQLRNFLHGATYQ